MKFFLGKAIGPVLAPYDYKSNSGARSAKIHINIDDRKDNDPMSFYFNGGPYFEDMSQEGMSVLAWYEFDSKKLPAILYIKYGQVIMSEIVTESIKLASLLFFYIWKILGIFFTLLWLEWKKIKLSSSKESTTHIKYHVSNTNSFKWLHEYMKKKLT